MKKLVLLIAVVFTALAASAQNSAKTTAESMETGKTSGVFTFELPNTVTNEQVDGAKKYYVQYFTVGYNNAEHLATVTLTENAEINRRVIQRFLVNFDIRTIQVDGKSLTLEEFHEAYLK